LARQGVDRLVLLSRRGPQAPGVDGLVAELTALGANTTVAACDVADRGALEVLLKGLADDGTTIRGVVHAAGVGQDTAVRETAVDEYADVVSARVTGALLLDELLDVTRFVGFA